MEIEIDDFMLSQHIEHYIDRLMERQINHYIQFKLQSIVEARLASLRLYDPSFPSLDDHITKRLGAMVDATVKEILPALVDAKVKEILPTLVSAGTKRKPRKGAPT
ncbi:MAG: hypothetical protein KatS3mg015_2659 [Fimbriimonadales bacterium]|nr:MAG: hypothetical protein KatS3mg015_2659 [Fimbriimonadales bacterium]